MSDRPEWFAPQAYGIGSGAPISWQGWLILVGYGALITAAAIWLGDRPLALLSIVAPATVLLVIICVKTTRGGWRWRWGDSE